MDSALLGNQIESSINSISTDLVRQLLFVTVSATIKVIRLNFNTCFGAQLGAFCTACDTNWNNPAACTGCLLPYSLSSGACSLSCSSNEYLGPNSQGLPKCYSCLISDCNTCQLNFPDLEPICKQCEAGLDFDSKVRKCLYVPIAAEVRLKDAL